jgi:hypothetical protein
VERWLRLWLDLVDVYLRPTTLRGYREHVHRYLVPYLGHHTLAELGTLDVQQMLRGLAAHRTPVGRLMAPATIARILATLRTALAGAVRCGKDLSRSTRPLPPAHPGPLDAIRWCGLADASRRGGPVGHAHPWRSGTPITWPRPCAAAATTGSSPCGGWPPCAGRGGGELCGLTRSTVDLDEQTLTVAEQVICVDGRTHVGPPKSLASRRTIALDDATVAVLRHHRRLQQAEAEGWTGSAPCTCRRCGCTTCGTARPA